MRMAFFAPAGEPLCADGCGLGPEMSLKAESHAAHSGGETIRRSWFLALLAIVAGAMLLRAWSRTGQGLWFDEAFSWRLATFPWTELVRRAALDNNPPLYYLLLKCWMLIFGESPAALTSLSIVFSGLACAGLYAFVCEAYRPQTKQSMALVAAALLATNGFQVYWGGQVRMYALVAALATASSWLLLRALHAREHRFRHWLRYAIAALIFAYSHTYALFSLAAHGLFVAGFLAVHNERPSETGRRDFLPQLVGPLLAAAIIAAGWLPWLPVLLRQHAQVHDAFWLPPLTWWGVRNAWHTLISGPASAGGGTIQSLVCAAPIFALMLLLWRPRAADWFVLLAAVVPLAGGIAISALDRNILDPRYLIAAQPFILVAVAKLMLAVPKPALRTAIVSLLVVLSVVLNREVVGRAPVAPSGIRAAAAYVDAARGDESPVIGTCPLFYLPFVYSLREHANSFLFDNGLPLPHYEGTAALADGELLDGREIAAIGSPKVFVVSNFCPLANQTGYVELPAEWRLVRRTEFHESYGIPGTLTVTEYQTK